MVRSPHGFLIASIADRLSDGPFHITPVLCELIGGELRHRVYYTLLKFGASVLTLGRGKCCGFFVNFLYQKKEFVCRFQQRLSAMWKSSDQDGFLGEKHGGNRSLDMDIVLIWKTV